MRGRRVWFAIVFATLVIWGGAGPALAVEVLLDLTPTCLDFCGGIQWVVEVEHPTIPGRYYLVGGTGFFPGGVEQIGDNRDGFVQTRKFWDVGESLYVVLHPRELSSDARRRVYIATENTGQFGYFDTEDNTLTVIPGEPEPPPGEPDLRKKCGTSIGYHPDKNAVYFGFVHCSDNNQTTIHKHDIGGNTTTLNFAPIGFAVHGPWILMNTVDDNGLPVQRLWNTGHDRGDDRVCILQQEADDSLYTPLECFEPSSTGQGTPGDFGSYFNHAKFANGFYYSEFHPSGKNARAYRVTETPEGVARIRTTRRTNRGTSPISAKAFTFLEDTTRTPNRIYAFVTDPNGQSDGTIWVACSTNGVDFRVVDSGFNSASSYYGPTGSVATVWRQPDGVRSVVWGHTPTAQNVFSHALVVRSTAQNC